MRKNRSKIFITSALLIMGLAACGKSDDKSDKSTSENTDISTELSTDDTGSTAASSTESGSTTETDSTTEQGSTTETGSTTTEASSTLTPAGIGITTEVIDNTSTTTEANGFPNGFSMDNIDGLGGLTTQDPNQGNGPSSVNEEICNAYIDVLKKNEDAINAYNFQYSYTVYDEIVPEDKSSTPVAFADVNTTPGFQVDGQCFHSESFQKRRQGMPSAAGGVIPRCLRTVPLSFPCGPCASS